MKTILLWGLFAVFLNTAIASKTIEKKQALSNKLHSELNALLKRDQYNHVKIGVQIQEIKKKRAHTLYAHNKNSLLTPASTLKTILSAAVLHKYPSKHRFETHLLTDSKKVTTRLNGNLYIKGLGDPSFSEENILNMVSSLIEKNIQTVSGNLYYDDFNFQTKNSFKTIQNARYYYAPESALSCNYNKLSLMIDNASTPSITLKKETGYAKIKHNDLVVLDTKKAYWPKISYQQKKWGDDYRIQGAVSLADQKNDYLDVLVSQPGLYSATLFKEACEKRGITFLGKIQRRATPKHSKLLHVEKGKLLSDILLELNQNSNNVIARQLNHHLAKKRRQSVSSYELGTKAVRSFCIKKIKLKKGSFLIDDISGLSKNNKISPDAFSNALHYFYKKKHRYQALFSSLIQVGKHPLYRKEPPQNLDVFFKTGTLPKTGVNALVGYIKDKQSETLYTIVILAERQDKRPAYSGSLTFPVLHKTMALLNRNL